MTHRTEISRRMLLAVSVKALLLTGVSAQVFSFGRNAHSAEQIEPAFSWVFKGFQNDRIAISAANAYYRGDILAVDKLTSQSPEKAWSKLLTAISYDRGFGVVQNKKEATDRYIKVSEMDNGPIGGVAAYLAAVNIDAGQVYNENYNEQFKLLMEKSAKSGVPDAYDYLGSVTYPSDPLDAKEYWKHAYELLATNVADQAEEDPHSMHLLATMLERGITPGEVQFEQNIFDTKQLGFDPSEVEKEPFVYAFEIYRINKKAYAPSAWAMSNIIDRCFLEIEGDDEAKWVSLDKNHKAKADYEQSLNIAAQLGYPKAFAARGDLKSKTNRSDEAVEDYMIGARYGDPRSIEKAAKLLLVDFSKPRSESQKIRGLTMLKLAEASGGVTDDWLDDVNWSDFDQLAYDSADAAIEKWKQIPYDFDAWTLHSGFGPSGWYPSIQRQEIKPGTGSAESIQKQCMSILSRYKSG